MLKKVLVITYYWPPSAGAGVYRWLKFVKYLRNYGWEPIIYTPLNPETPAVDETLLNEIPENITVIKTSIWEPYFLYKKLLGLKKHEKINAGFLNETYKPKLIEKLATWLRGNLFIPDPRMFWIRPSVKYLKEYLSKNKIDAIVSTGPPHSTHRIALKLHRLTKIPWLADFRDPWTGIDFYHKLMLTRIADKLHHKQEQEVLQEADIVVTVSKNWAKDLELICNRSVNVVYNGFDEVDFIDLKNIYPEKFRLSHIGALNKDRNPQFFWEVLAEIINENPKFADDLEIQLVGKTDISALEDIKNNKLNNYTKIVKYLTHKEAIKHEFGSAVLLLFVNNTPNSLGIVPGKLFEYLATLRPILCIGPLNGDSATIIKEANAGEIVEFQDKQSLKKIIYKLYADFLAGKFVNVNSDKLSKFNRKYLTGEIASLLNDIITK